MGSSTSKAARKLPTTTPSQARPLPKWAGARTPQSDPLYPDGVEPSPSASSSAQSGSTAAGSPSTTGKARAGFSGEKDDGSSIPFPLPSCFQVAARNGRQSSCQALKRDAMDPQFMSNLSRMGQVQIQDAVAFVRTTPLAQRTLQARTPEYTTPGSLPPAGSLTAPSLVSLLDRLKTLAPGADVSKVYREFGVDASAMEEVRRWVNSVSVGEEDEVRVEEGNRIIEMKAVWVDSAKAAAPRVSGAKP